MPVILPSPIVRHTVQLTTITATIGKVDMMHYLPKALVTCFRVRDRIVTYAPGFFISRLTLGWAGALPSTPADCLASKVADHA
jgi:hypothetical protein